MGKFFKPFSLRVKKTSFCSLKLFLSGSGLSPLMSFSPDYPQAEISNGILSAKIFLPDPDNGYYRSTRFDWSGAVNSLIYNGHEYYEPWYDKIDPKIINWVHKGSKIVCGPCSALYGPVDEFQIPLGYNEAKPGGLFIKIGVGVLKRGDGEYNQYYPYEVINSGKWLYETNKNSVEFSQDLSDTGLGYSYIYKKVVRLEKGKPEMVIEHCLKNTGTLPVSSNVYNHNFIVLDKQAPGPEFTFKVPYQIQASQLPDKELAFVSGNHIVYRKELSGEDEAVVIYNGSGNDLKNTEIIIENNKAGAGIQISANRPITKNLLWSIRSVIAIEPFIAVDIQPGSEFTWNNVFRYYTLD